MRTDDEAVSLFLRHCNWKGEAACFWKGECAELWDLLLQMSNRTQSSHRLRGPPARAFRRIQLRYAGGSFESFTCRPPAHPPSPPASPAPGLLLRRRGRQRGNTRNPEKVEYFQPPIRLPRSSLR